MNPFNQAWVILKNLDYPPSVDLMSNKLTPSELGEYELLDTHRKIDYLNARMYTECDECGYIHNEPVCGYCKDVEGEHNPNPQHSKTRFGNKEFANEKELLDYLELNPPKQHPPEPNKWGTQFKLTNFADIGAGEKPVMYFHGTEGEDVPNIMREGLRPEKMQTHRTDDWERMVARVKPEGKHDLSGVLPSLYKNPEWIKQLYRRRPGEELRMQDLIDDMVNEHRGIGIHEDGRYYGDKKGAQAIRSEAERNSELKPSIFMGQPTLGAKSWVTSNLHNDPQMIGVRGMRQPDIYGERNIDDTHDLNLPEKIIQENIPIEDLVFYGGIQNPQIDEAIQNYRNMHEQGIVPKPGYFPTQEDYDRYNQMIP